MRTYKIRWTGKSKNNSWCGGQVDIKSENDKKAIEQFLKEKKEEEIRVIDYYWKV